MNTQLMDDNYAKDFSDYDKAMRNGDHSVCFTIETKNGLLGLTPELVSIVLSEASKGKDIDVAIDEVLY